MRRFGDNPASWSDRLPHARAFFWAVDFILIGVLLGLTLSEVWV